MTAIVRGLSLLLLLPFSGVARTDALSVTTLSLATPQEGRPTGEYRMVFVESGAPGAASRVDDFMIRMVFVESGVPGVASRINDFTFLAELESAAPGKRDDGGSTAVAELPRGLTELDYQVLRNDDHLFSVSIEREGCGAYCETYHNYHNFAAGSGRHLGLSDLFSTAGWTAFSQQLAAARQDQIKDAIRVIDKEREEIQGVTDPGLDYMKEQFQQCAVLVADPLYVSKVFSIDGKTVTFIRERCSNHALRALDEIGEFANVYDFEALRPYLSDYGKTLLLNDGNAQAPASPINQVLHGTIGGTLPITILLGDFNHDDSLDAIYYDDNHRRVIRLAGTRHGDVLTLTEYESAATPAPAIIVRMDGDRLTGKWVGKEELSFEAAP